MTLVLKSANAAPQQVQQSIKSNLPVIQQQAMQMPQAVQSAINQAAIANAMQGVTQITPSIQIGGIVKPTKITATINSLASGAVDATILLFNNTVLGPFSTDPTKTVINYSDGFAGKFFSQLLTQAGDNGLACYGFNVTATNAAGVLDTNALNLMNATMRYYTGFGPNFLPSSFDTNGSERKTDYKNGIMTVRSIFPITSLSQFAFFLPAAYTFQFTFFLDPIIDAG